MAKKIILSVAGVLLLLWVMGIILENFFNVDLDKYFNRSSPAPQVAEAAPPPASEAVAADWQTYKNDSFHFSLSVPFELTEAPLSSAVSINSLKANGKSKDMRFMIQVTAIQIRDANLDLGKAVSQEVKAFQMMDKVMVDLQLTSSPVTMADAEGILTQGSYKAMGLVEQDMKFLKIRKGGTLLDVLLQYKPTDEYKAQADKILQSLSFTN